MKKHTLIMSIGLLFALSTSSFAYLITDSPELPTDGVYVAEGLHSYSFMGIYLTNLTFQPVGPVDRTDLGGGDELEEFDTVFTATEFNVGLGPITLDGGMAMVAVGKVDETIGTFPSEIVGALAQGVDPTGTFGAIVIQESPTLDSVGQTTITDIGDGLYRIDSSFNVYTELYNGQAWIPCDGPTVMTLVPEPASLSLIGLVAGGMYFVRRFFSA